MVEKISSHKRVYADAGWNLCALVVPLMVGIFTIPLLINKLGIDRFGFLSLMWTIVGYFGLFDLGIGRALTQQLATGIGRNDAHTQRTIVWTGLILMTAVGALIGFCISLIASFTFIFNEYDALTKDMIKSGVTMGLGSIVVISSSGLRGVLEAYAKFKVVNVVRLLLGVWSFGAPAVMVCLGTKSLYLIAICLVIGRIIGALVSYLFVNAVLEGVGRPAYSRTYARELLRFGSWVSVASLISPFMASLDRFLVGFFVGAAGVAYYSTPQDMILKVLFVPISISTVLLPRLSRLQEPNDSAVQKDVGLLIARSLVLALLVVGLVAGTVALLAPELLAMWIGKEFSRYSALSLQIMALGVVLNTVGIVVQSAIYASGRSREVAILQLIELPLYFIGQCIFVYLFGLTGAACAWTIRIAFDSLIMWRIARLTCFTPLPNGRYILCGLCLYLTFCSFALVAGFSLIYRLTFLFCLAIFFACLALRMIWDDDPAYLKKNECLA
jgi:O-antigen/teichoic acid export membrane protein